MLGTFLIFALLVVVSSAWTFGFGGGHDGSRTAPTRVSASSTSTSTSSLPVHVHVDVEDVPVGRRALFQSLVVGVGVSTAWIAAPALAAAPAAPSLEKEKPMFTQYTSDVFSLQVPTSWNVITKLGSSKKPSTTTGGSTLFSAIDFQSGSVITIVREHACSIQEYASSSTTSTSTSSTCDLLLPSSALLFSEESSNRAKDVTKLLIRHDDRDNAVLQGTSQLQSYSKGDSNGDGVVELMATTVLPSGGTYRDTMGLDQPSTITRMVKAKAKVETILAPSQKDSSTTTTTTSTDVYSVWLSAPEDEWQNPAMGTRLRQTWESVRLTTTPP
jgi:hypothetical protein